MELFEIVEHFWIDLQLGQLPDLGGWNYGLMAIFILLQGRLSAVVSGVAAAAGYLNLGPIILIALLIRIIVDLAWYRLGTTGHIDRIGRHMGLYRYIAEPVRADLKARPMRFLFFAKVSNGLSIPAVVMAGNARLPLRSWLPGSFLGDLLWTIPLLLFGYFATDALSTINGGLTYMTFAFSAVFLVGFIVKVALQKRSNSS